MAIKKISEFVSGTPTSDSKILFEQNEKGKSCTIGDAVNTCSLTYEEIMATNPVPDLSGKIASAGALYDSTLKGEKTVVGSASAITGRVRINFSQSIYNFKYAAVIVNQGYSDVALCIPTEFIKLYAGYSFSHVNPSGGWGSEGYLEIHENYLDVVEIAFKGWADLSMHVWGVN